MNTAVFPVTGLRRDVVIPCRFRARGFRKGFGETSLQVGFHSRIVTGDGANGFFCIRDRYGEAAKTPFGGFVAALAAIEPGPPRACGGEMPDWLALAFAP